jgi:hypothetical protein
MHSKAERHPKLAGITMDPSDAILYICVLLLPTGCWPLPPPSGPGELAMGLVQAGFGNTMSATLVSSLTTAGCSWKPGAEVSQTDKS